jgi:hypothetical protein
MNTPSAPLVIREFDIDDDPRQTPSPDAAPVPHTLPPYEGDSGDDGDRDEEDSNADNPADDDANWLDGLANLPRVDKSPRFYPGWR